MKTARSTRVAGTSEGLCRGCPANWNRHKPAAGFDIPYDIDLNQFLFFPHSPLICICVTVGEPAVKTDYIMMITIKLKNSPSASNS